LRLSIELNQQGLAINPSIPNLHNGVGIAASELARAAWEAGEDPTFHLQQARSAYEGAITVAPNQGYGHLNLADLLLWQGRYLERAASLEEAGRLLHRRLKAEPEERDLWAYEGRRYGLRAERALREGRDPAPDLRAGEAALAKALKQDAHDGEAQLYLGELRAAGAAWRVKTRQAESGDFDRAAQPLNEALRVNPTHPEASLAFARLLLARGAWERSKGLDPGPSLALGRATLDRVLKPRPQWAEALAVGAALTLEEAEGLPAGKQAAKARVALQAFEAALALNRNLAGEWAPRRDRARRLEAGA
jgi:tetratricopeptide (TPR) repeat protein